MGKVFKYLAENEFYQNGIIRINFFYSQQETAPLHTHDFFEVFLVTEGVARHIINKQEVLIKKNDLVFIRPQDIHQYMVYENQPFKMVNFSYNSNIIRAIKAFFDDLEDIDGFINASMPYSTRLNEMQKNYFIKRLLNFSYSRNTNSRELRLSVQKLILELFYNYYNTSKNESFFENNAPDWFNDLFIKLDSKEFFTLPPNEFITQIGRNPQYVMRVFKQITGKNITEYLNFKRLDYAYTLLRMSDMKITDIAYECGYESISTFYHSFQRYFKCTPKSIRKQNKPKSVETD